MFQVEKWRGWCVGVGVGSGFEGGTGVETGQWPVAWEVGDSGPTTVPPLPRPAGWERTLPLWLLPLSGTLSHTEQK